MIYEFHEVASIFPLMSESELENLIADIREHGQREPIWLHKGKIIDGRNRYHACQALDIEPKTRNWNGEDSLVAFVVSLNLHRRHLDESQRAMVGARIRPMFEGEARERMLAGKRPSESQLALHAAKELSNPSVNWREGVVNAKSSGRAAEAVNVSPRAVERATRVLKEGAQALVEAVDRGEVSVSAAAVIAEVPHAEQEQIVARGEKEILEAAKEIRARQSQDNRQRRVEKILSIAKNNQPLHPELGVFNVLYVDPPWFYNQVRTDSRSLQEKYPTMKIEDICALPVKDIAAPDAVLFLWVTTPLSVIEAPRVLEAWGFTFKTKYYWDKQIAGMGHYGRGQVEELWIATRGNMVVPEPSNRQPNLLSIRRGEHSAKPEEFYKLIEQLYPEFPKIELFARGQRDNWNVWGNQSLSA